MDEPEYKIEKGVPIPNKRVDTLYPLHDLAVGDSFLVPLDRRHAASAKAYDHARNGGKKFEVRTVEGGVRVWRTR